MSNTLRIPRAKTVEMLAIMFNEQDERIGELQVQVTKLTRALAKLGCSCTQKTRDPDLEAHEKFCLYKMAMEDIGHG